jgi:hypothetical protein
MDALGTSQAVAADGAQRGALRFKFPTTVLVLLCFGALAWLNGRDLFGQHARALLFAGVGLVLLLVCLLLVAALNTTGAASGLATAGFGTTWGLVARGFLIIVPLTALAFLAEFAFDWHAAQAFIQASLMTSGAAAGAELMRRGRPRTRYLVVSMLVAVVFCVGWTVLVAYFPWHIVDGLGQS